MRQLNKFITVCALDSGQYHVSLCYIRTIGAQWGTQSCLFSLSRPCTKLCKLVIDCGTRSFTATPVRFVSIRARDNLHQGSKLEGRKEQPQCNIILPWGSLINKWTVIKLIISGWSQDILSTMTNNNSPDQNHQSFSSLDSSPPPLPLPILIFFPTKFVFFFLSAWLVGGLGYFTPIWRISPGLVVC